MCMVWLALSHSLFIPVSMARYTGSAGEEWAAMVHNLTLNHDPHLTASTGVTIALRPHPTPAPPDSIYIQRPDIWYYII